MKLKFSNTKNVEYIDIQKGKVFLKSYTSFGLKGMSWREFQLLLGKEFGPDTYHYGLKLLNKNEVHRGQIKGVNLKENKPGAIVPARADSKDLLLVNNAIDAINKRLDESAGSVMGVDAVLAFTRQGYEMQISFLNAEMVKKDNYIIKLEHDLDVTEKQIGDSSGKLGLQDWIVIGKEFLAMKAGLIQPVTNLSESNQSDIPPAILTLLGLADWSKVDRKIIDDIINYLNIFIQKLPMKGK